MIVERVIIKRVDSDRLIKKGQVSFDMVPPPPPHLPHRPLTFKIHDGPKSPFFTLDMILIGMRETGVDVRSVQGHFLVLKERQVRVPKGTFSPLETPVWTVLVPD